MIPALPARDHASEDAFVQRLASLGADAVIEAIEAALTERRPLLAARLVALLPEDASDAVVERARRARSLSVAEADPGDALWDDAFAEFVKRRARRRARTRRGRR